MRAALLAVMLVLVGCSRPRAPTITPEKASITSLGPGGIGMLLQLGLDNPNSFELAGRALTAKVVLDGTRDLGTVTVPNGIKLPAGKRTDLSVPMTLPWKDVTALIALAGQGRRRSLRGRRDDHPWGATPSTPTYRFTWPAFSRATSWCRPRSSLFRALRFHEHRDRSVRDHPGHRR